MKAYSNTAYPKRGFTLLECVVTLVIAGFIGAVITATMAYGVRIYQGLRIQSVGTSQVHVAAAVVKREEKGRFFGGCFQVEDCLRTRIRKRFTQSGQACRSLAGFQQRRDCL